MVGLALKVILALAVIGQGPLVITNDPGGIVATRAARVALIGDREVRIEGRCASACTMWLAAPNVCVAPDARLSFHGPSHFGLPLPRADFNYWSRVISNHYPESLAVWFMSVGRFGEYSIDGAGVIANGWARECD
jgi:hypothetical protein